MFAMVLVDIIRLLARLLSFALIAYVILGYFLPPYHSIRVYLARILEPLLLPIRRIVPPFQMIDFSPLILIILIQVVEFVLISLILSFR